jgi:hypothetical protein
MATKGSRLHELRQNGFTEFTLPMIIISREKFSKNFLELEVLELRTEWFAVRSSAPDEDQSLSNAGRYLTLLNVDRENLFDAVVKVFQSYESIFDSDEVLIQPYLRHTTRSGVVFTRDPNTNSEYYVINSNIGENTTTITSGSKNGRLEIVYAPLALSNDNPIIQRNSDLLKLVKQISDFYDGNAIDIEFAETNSRIFILQVRPLNLEQFSYSSPLYEQYFEDICKQIDSWKLPRADLLGRTTIFGIMPDWNPAEIIGVRPRPLALTLFKELITDAIWAEGRTLLGYRDVSRESILVEIAGQPYVDLRKSLNSLTPIDISSELASRVIDFSISKLIENPHLHDKIESEITFSSYTFDIDEKLDQLPLNINKSEKEELKNALIKLTRGMICGVNYGIDEVLRDFSPLETELSMIEQSDDSISRKISELVCLCKKYGTRPFASAARMAFVGTELINSLARKSLISLEASENYFKSIESVTSQFLTDWSELTSDKFLEKYRHLRPGTYDIRIPTYGKAFGEYFNTSNKEEKTRRTISNSRKQILAELKGS